jgi:Leucine-rich repeat (LRR) protein
MVIDSVVSETHEQQQYMASRSIDSKCPSQILLYSFAALIIDIFSFTTGKIPFSLGRNPFLETVYLFDNQLTGQLPTELGNLSSLEHLYLHFNSLTGPVPDSICDIVSLQDLTADCSATKMSCACCSRCYID